MTRHIDWLAVPIVTYDTDYLLSYGAGGQVQWSGEVDPYRHQLNFQVLFSTSGRQSHFIRYDAPHFLGSKLRVWALAEFEKEDYAPYYGLGNATSETLPAHSPLSTANAFVYDRTQPLGRLGASYPLLSNLYAFAFATYLDMQVTAPEGSLLAQQAPLGIAGGHELQGEIGVYRDTRDHESVPTRGALLEASVRGASQGFGSSYSYGGVNARALGFVPFGSRLVLAMRLEGDILSAGAPFFDLNQFGGVDNVEGLGGDSGGRGLPQDRFIGRGKVLGTIEPRLTLGSHKVFGEPLSFGVVGFVDAGRVWQFDGSDGPWYGLHAGYGGGIRLWRRSFVLRVDVASSVERPFNCYILFGHAF